MGVPTNIASSKQKRKKEKAFRRLLASPNVLILTEKKGKKRAVRHPVH